MSDFYRRPERKPTRKAHRCNYCGQEIPKGAQNVEQTGVWDGAAFRNRFHPECFGALRKDGEGEFTPYSEERPVVVGD